MSKASPKSGSKRFTSNLHQGNNTNMLDGCHLVVGMLSYDLQNNNF